MDSQPKPVPSKTRRSKRAGALKVNLSPGDTIHFKGGGRFVLKQSGANGGAVKGVVVGGKIQKGGK